MRAPVIFAVIWTALWAGCSTAPANPWAQVTAPDRGASRSIGGPSAGCLAGAVSLPPDGPGFELMRLTRRRFYGHERLVRFIQAFGDELRRRGLGPVLVGDLGQARGGPAPSGHRSHQTGLDVDLWFWKPDDLGARSLTLDERERLSPPSMVAPDGLGVAALWSARQETMLRVATSFGEVERVFVNPAIKKDLCALHRGEPWLHKLRPWWGHDDHFHVRLSCAPGDTDCKGQDPIPPGDGCDATLEWWFTAEARAKGQEEAPVSRLPALPAACKAVLEAR